MKSMLGEHRSILRRYSRVIDRQVHIYRSPRFTVSSSPEDHKDASRLIVTNGIARTMFGLGIGRIYPQKQRAGLLPPAGHA